jgi:hypothetical protein
MNPELSAQVDQLSNVAGLDADGAQNAAAKMIAGAVGKAQQKARRMVGGGPARSTSSRRGSPRPRRRRSPAAASSAE